MTDEKHHLMIKEQWLREEIRTTRATAMNLIQWGVTVLAAIESSLYYARRDVAEHLVKVGSLPANGLLPWPRWFLGTLFLTVIAYIFTSLLRYTQKKHVVYRKQLIGMKPSYSGIEEGPTGSRLHMFPHVMFFLFPLFDQGLWLTFSVARSFNIPW